MLVWLFEGWEDGGGDDCQLHRHVCFDWREALCLGLLSLTRQMFCGGKMGLSSPAYELADGKLKLFAPSVLHLHSRIVATRLTGA